MNGKYIYGVNPLDAALGQASNLAPDARLEIVWKHYEEETGKSLDRPVTEEQRFSVRQWIYSQMSSAESKPYPSLSTTKPIRTFHAFAQMSRKASLSTQLRCPICSIKERADGSAVLCLGFPINIEPWTNQAKRDKVRLVTAVRASLQEHRIRNPLASLPCKDPICISVAAILGKGKRTKDTDNLIKGLLDALKGVYYVDDSQVQCITTRRFQSQREFGYYLVSITAVYPHESDVILLHDDLVKNDWPRVD
jgi:Holliday junction resolvase RusA-like endonuclease